MSKVLVVDDERDYCEELSIGLTRDGHQVMFATNSDEAVRVGTAIKPDVLLTDWLLRESSNGLHIHRTLRATFPNMRTILMTGYASQDLKGEANELDVISFLEKPFTMETVREAVKVAANANIPSHQNRFDEIGFLEVESDGRILFVNTKARTLLHLEVIRHNEIYLQSIIGAKQYKSLDRAGEKWVDLSLPPPYDRQLRARICNFPNAPYRTVLLLTKAVATKMEQSDVVNRLLNLETARHEDSPVQGHVLVIDDAEDIRKIAASIFRELGLICHTAATHEEAIRLFAHDSRIQHVIVDFEMPEGKAPELVERMRALRQDIHFIGSSGGNYGGEFSRVGIEDFLKKPWNLNRLLEMLSDSPRRGEINRAPYQNGKL